MDIDELRRIAGKMRIPLGTVEKDYAITIVLGILSELEYSNYLAFKGGTAIKKIYYPDARFSMDLDFSCYEDLSDDLLSDFGSILSEPNIFDVDFTDIVEEERRDEGVRLSIRYNDANKHPNSIKLDLSLREKPIAKAGKIAVIDDYGIGDELTCVHLGISSIDSEFKRRHFRCELLEDHFYSKNRCFTCKHFTPSEIVERDELKNILIRTLKLEEILAEKIRAIIARDAPRDLYDIWFLVNKGVKIRFDLINKKLEKLKVDKEFDMKIFEDRVNAKGKNWSRDLEPLLHSPPNFGTVKNEVISQFRRYTSSF